jgi:hypothetical protein
MTSLTGNEQQIGAIVGIGLLNDFKSGGFDHPAERACGEVEQVLVDEPFLDDIFGADDRDIRRIEDQKSAIPKDTPVVGQDTRGTGEVFDRVAGMNDIEAPGFECDIFDTRRYQLRAIEIAA